MPAHALQVNSGGVCTGPLSLTFTPGLSLLPAARTFAVSGTLGCTGLGATSFSVSNTTMFSAAASCAGLVATGSGAMTFGSSSPAMTIAMVGVGPAQVWIGIDSSGNAGLTAAGVFTWTNLGEITSCATTGTATMSLWGAFVVVT